MLLWVDLFGDQITWLIYCLYISEFVSSVHFELNCNVWGFEACLRLINGNRNRLTVQQGANSFAVHTVESYLLC